MSLLRNGSRVLVTGGGGFIGSHLVEALLDRGNRVRVLDNFQTGKRENLAEVRHRIELIEGDLCDPPTVREACQGVTVIFHQAAIPSVPWSIEHPEQNHQVNASGTFQLLLAAQEAGVRRLVYAASSAAYGPRAEGPGGACLESQLPEPLSPYAVAKLVGEYYCQVFASIYRVETVALRYFNIFGPRQDPSSPYSGVISRFIQALLARVPPVLHGDGEQSRDFTYVANVVEANCRAAESTTASGRVINVGVGERTTLNQLLAELQTLLGTAIPPSYEPARVGDIRHSLADLRLAAETLGYAPVVGVTEGLRRTVAWYQAQGSLG
ncbi:MAG: SDR family oxidoreductase [Blastocatellia bacterium]